MVLEGLSPHHNKIYDYLKDGQYTTPEKLVDADKIALGTKLSKGVVANLLMDLEKKGWVKRIARGKAAGYCIVKFPGEAPKASGEGNFTADDFF